MSNLLHSASRRALCDYARFMLSLDGEKQAEIPSGPKLFVANHPTTVDPAILTLLTEERIRTLITGLCFDMPVLGPSLRKAGHVPVVAGKGRHAFDRARELLNSGQNVPVFPEGALSPAKGGVYPLRNGAARLALSTGVAVIPVGISLDPERIRRVDISRLYLDGPYAMTMGAPLYFKGEMSDRRRVLGVSGLMRHEIIRLAYLSGQRLGKAQQALVQPSLSWAKAIGLVAA